MVILMNAEAGQALNVNCMRGSYQIAEKPSGRWTRTQHFIWENSSSFYRNNLYILHIQMTKIQ